MHPKDSLKTVLRLTETQEKALKKLGLVTVSDLLYHFPARYVSTGDGTTVTEAVTGNIVTLFGTVTKLKIRKGFRSRIPMAEGSLDDGTGKVKLIWMHQPYIAKMIPEGSSVKVSGKLSEKNGGRSIMNPEIEVVPAGAIVSRGLFGGSTSNLEVEPPSEGLFPVYPESRGITSRWFFYTIAKLFSSGVLDTLSDPIPHDILKRYNLPALKTALVWIHTPKTETDSIAARKRFAFEEVFLIQLRKQQERARNDQLPSWNITASKETTDEFVERFPFAPTKGQTKAVHEILKDFSNTHAMSRLLEGDVGSGKTFVAATTAHAVVTSRPDATKDFGNLQVAYMAPTEILATQHFESFIDYFRNLPIAIGLITSSGCKKFPSKVNPKGWTDISRTQLLKWVANGEIPILIGTHSLIQKTVKFKHLAYVIIDEQHRFGTKQRAELARKTDVPDKNPWRLPHLLSMTATPIPRTLALTIFGDLDLTLLDEMPAGRKEIITKIVPPAERKEVYEHIRKEIANGRQAYIICPRIDLPAEASAQAGELSHMKELALRAKSVEAEAERLSRDVFPELTLGVLHGKMKTDDKEHIMKEFSEGTIDILVATSVVEVGVNVPNATTIVIEGAERFGLSQLHQLRGRVLRSTHQAHCFLFSESKGQTTVDRLKALTKAKNGFELAEHDLSLRGAGELYGGRQWGISDVGMEALRNLKMVEAARNEARQLIEKDPELKGFPILREAMLSRDAIHFE